MCGDLGHPVIVKPLTTNCTSVTGVLPNPPVIPRTFPRENRDFRRYSLLFVGDGDFVSRTIRPNLTPDSVPWSRILTSSTRGHRHLVGRGGVWLGTVRVEYVIRGQTKSCDGDHGSHLRSGTRVDRGRISWKPGEESSLRHHGLRGRWWNVCSCQRPTGVTSSPSSNPSTDTDFATFDPSRCELSQRRSTHTFRTSHRGRWDGEREGTGSVVSGVFGLTRLLPSGLGETDSSTCNLRVNPIWWPVSSGVGSPGISTRVGRL